MVALLQSSANKRNQFGQEVDGFGVPIDGSPVGGQPVPGNVLAGPPQVAQPQGQSQNGLDSFIQTTIDPRQQAEFRALPIEEQQKHMQGQQQPIGVPNLSTVQPQAPATGLIGAEQSLLAGAQGGTAALVEGFDVATGNIQAGRTGALGALDAAKTSIGTGVEQARQDVLTGAQTGQEIIGTGVDQSNAALARRANKAQGFLRAGGEQAQEQISAGVGALEQGEQRGIQVLNEAFQSAVDPISGFVDPGRRAQALQAAMTGALGPEAQAAAVKNFSQDPGTKFAVEESERALARNAARFGGLGGGNVRKELSRQATGRALQNFNNRISQLGGIAAQGLSAAQTVGQLEGQRGQSSANLIGQTASSIAGQQQAGAGISADIGSLSAELKQRTGETIAQAISSGSINQAEIETAAANTISGLTQEAGFAEADINAKAADIERTTGVNLAELAQQTGINVSGILENLGSNSAELRIQAGRDLANAIATGSGQLADLQAAQGAGIADITGAQIGDITNILVKEGLIDAQASERLATLLGNISLGQGTTTAQISSNIGDIEAAGVLGTNKAVQTGIDALSKMAGKDSVTAGTSV